MEEKRKINNSEASPSFTDVLEISQMGDTSVPLSYVLPLIHRPNLGPSSIVNNPALLIPPIDLSLSQQPNLKPRIMKQVRFACKEFGIFQVINHGMPPSVMSDAFDAATEFFALPHEEKIALASANLHEPVRYGTSINHAKDKCLYWRDFIKHYSHPLSTWIEAWPSNPPSYKKKMGDYAQAAYMLHKQLTEVVFESLGLNPNYSEKDIEKGSQVIAVNCYPRCPEPDLVLGIPPHSDYGYLTIILQRQQGLEIMNRNKQWCQIPVQEGALVVQMGDQMEIISNGQYRSPVHRATVNKEKDRISIASLHSLGLDQKVAPASEFVNEQHPALYKQGSFTEFLDFVSENDLIDQRYLDTLKINP